MSNRVLVVAVAAIVCAGLGGGLGWAFLVRDPGSDRVASPSVRALLSSPSEYYGRRVTMVGSVSTVYNGHAITLGTPLAPGLLVTAKDTSLLAKAPLHARVRVTGVARSFTVPQWQAWTGGTSDLRTLATYDGRPVVRADTVFRIGGGGAAVTSPAHAKATTRP
jgi:hypothetical protein